MPKTKSPTRSPTNTQAAPIITLRIAGLGHHFELPIESTSTLLELKQTIEKRIDLAPEYQRLVAKHKSMDDDSMVLGGTIYNVDSGVQSIGIGLVDKTKILLLHSAQYTQDKDGVDTLNELNKQIDEIDAKRISRELDNVAVHEFITQLCCKIDGVETNGSEALRRMRKGAIRKAEGVARKSDESKRGIDP
ncbi:hypothetical protein ACHAXN_007762 [Cyclotella atomus]